MRSRIVGCSLALALSAFSSLPAQEAPLSPPQSQEAPDTARPEESTASPTPDAQDADRTDRSRTNPEARRREGLLARLGVALGAANNDRRGLLLDRVERGGLFGNAGLQPGDTVVDIDGNRVSSAAELLDWMQSADLDRRMTVTVDREGRRRTFELDVPRYRRFFENLTEGIGGADAGAPRYETNRPDYDERWDDELAGTARPPLGVTLDSRYNRSAIVARVFANSAAAEAGLRAGDRIVSVNGRALRAADELARVIASLGPGQWVELEYERPIRASARVQLGGAPEREAAPPAPPSHDPQ